MAVEVVAAEAANKRSEGLARFLQALLGAEASQSKTWSVFNEARFDRELVVGSSLWTSAERDRLCASIAFAPKEGSILPWMTDALKDRVPDSERPVGLFVDGNPDALTSKSVAIVGTRAAGIYGRAVAQKFAQTFAEAGLAVVSGGALGIDAAAHEGALKGGGQTVAVLAGGVDRIYPAKHAGLFQRIRQQGCLVSQFAVGSRPDRFKFLIRNRLVAGLCHALVVIEAPERSGALATASAAADMGREVFVVPSNIDNYNFRGSHALIRDGATLCDHPDQVLSSLKVRPAVAKAPQLTKEEAALLKAFQNEAKTVDELAEATGLSTSEISAELSMLELQGLVLKDGRHYRPIVLS